MIFIALYTDIGRIRPATHVFRHHEHGLGFGFGARAQLVRQQQERADDQPVHQQFSSAPAHSAHMVHHLETPRGKNEILQTELQKEKRSSALRAENDTTTRRTHVMVIQYTIHNTMTCTIRTRKGRTWMSTTTVVVVGTRRYYNTRVVQPRT